MIDPTNITNYNLTDTELEEHILFWVCVAGKNGHLAAKGLNKFLSVIVYNKMTPFGALRNRLIADALQATDLPTIKEMLRQSGIGCYTNKAITMVQLAQSGLNLRTCSTDDLESIYGIGMKTSRCFILHSRKNAQYAGLDTHMLKYLKEMGVENVPKSTPSSKKLYLTLEKEVLSLAGKAGMSPADYDLEVWRRYAVIPKGGVL